MEINNVKDLKSDEKGNIEENVIKDVIDENIVL